MRRGQLGATGGAALDLAQKSAGGPPHPPHSPGIPGAAPHAAPQGDSAQQAQAVADLCTVLEAVRVAALLLAPITPALSARVAAQLGMSTEEAQVGDWLAGWGVAGRRHRWGPGASGDAAGPVWLEGQCQGVDT